MPLPDRLPSSQLARVRLACEATLHRAVTPGYALHALAVWGPIDDATAPAHETCWQCRRLLTPGMSCYQVRDAFACGGACAVPLWACGERINLDDGTSSFREAWRLILLDDALEDEAS